MKSVTGQVRWQVTGMNPTRKGAAAAVWCGAKRPRLSVAWSKEMATSQSTTLKPTIFPEDIKVGKDVPKLGAMSSGILGRKVTEGDRG